MKSKYVRHGVVASRGAANHLPGAAVSRPAVGPAVQGKGVVQRYTEKDGGKVKISDNKMFAVVNEGDPKSEMFVKDGSLIQPLVDDVVRFHVEDGGSEAPLGMLKVKRELNMSDDEVKKYHCGDFSEKLTGIREDVENGTARPGRSLFADQLEWGVTKENKKRGNWGNHYAPVIVADDGDRGTFETAVTVDHAWFGIYGQKRGQTFRLKTVVADIELARSREMIDIDTYNQLISEIQNYIKTGGTESEDEFLKEELEKIADIYNKDPDIDQKFKEEEERSRKSKEEKDQVINLFQTEDVETIWKQVEGMNPSYLRFLLTHEIETPAKKSENETVLNKVKTIRQLLNGKEKSEPEGMSTVAKGAIALLATAVVGGLIYWLRNRKK